MLRGARPVFADIRPDTLNLDERHLGVADHAAHPGHRPGALRRRRLRDGRPSASSPRAHGVTVVEDNAHGLFGAYAGRPLGTFGALATLSFHETKNVTCGEGGALVVNDAELVERAEILREKGTNRSRFFRGEVDKYTWVDVGSSYLPSDMLAAFLLAQLEERARSQARRRKIWERYREALAGWAAANGVRLPTVPPECDQSYHMFYLLLPSLEPRQALIAHLQAARDPRRLPLPPAAPVAHGPAASAGARETAR